MAPTKLKQSSIQHFLRPQPSTNSPTDANDGSNNSPPDYELIRQENIRRNREYLKKLGISISSTSIPKPLPKKPNKIKPISSPSSVPLRRSARFQPSTSCEEDNDLDRGKQEQAMEQMIDSWVFRYACDRSLPLPDDRLSLCQSPIVGFEIVGKIYRDPSLTKIYSIDVSYLEDGKVLVAAGGHGGSVSIYGGMLGDTGDGESRKGDQEPLLSWKASQSWVSGTMFVQSNLMLLISSSNDGKLVVWDVKKHPALASLSSTSWSPPVVAETATLHDGGIFGLDRLGCVIATASKDSSLCVSRLTPEGEMVFERRVSGHHSGVIRGVCFRGDKDALADSGADGRICILDTRQPKACVITIESQHKTGVNTLDWCKSIPNLVLSASKDPALLLYDIRSPTEPAYRLQGHVEGNRTCSQIYRPAFIDDGKMIATPGERSRKISLYSVGDGLLKSQGLIGYDANIVKFSRDRTGCPILWAAARQINQLCLFQVSSC